jgi:hypothetical protein
MRRLRRIVVCIVAAGSACVAEPVPAPPYYAWYTGPYYPWYYPDYYYWPRVTVGAWGRYGGWHGGWHGHEHHFHGGGHAH